MAVSEVLERVLAGIVFQDAATLSPIRHPLHVRSPGLSLFRNRRHVYVVTRADGLEAHNAAIESAPAAPPVASLDFEVEVRDPRGMYLPRRFTLSLPRHPDPDDDAAALRTRMVMLFRSPRASKALHWAMVRARLNVAGGGPPIPAALLRVVFNPTPALPVPERLGIGMSVVADPMGQEHARRSGATQWVHFDARTIGEACVPVVGLSSTIWSDGGPAAGAPPDSVTLAEVPVALEVLPMTLVDGLPDPDEVMDDPVDPTNRFTFSLTVGQEHLAGPIEVTPTP